MMSQVNKQLKKGKHTILFLQNDGNCLPVFSEIGTFQEIFEVEHKIPSKMIHLHHLGVSLKNEISD